MKKIVFSLLFLILVFSTGLAEGPDGYLPAGWYDIVFNNGELYLHYVYLPDDLYIEYDGELLFFPVAGDIPAPVLPSSSVVSFTAAPGIYTVGVDFSSGVYSIRCADGSSWCIATAKDSDDKLVLSQVLNLEDGNYVGKIELLDGYVVKVENGSARFEAAIGVVFD